MRSSQHTLKKTYYFEGKGLHTGTYAHMKLLPAPPDTGIKFRRTDLRNKPVIDALAENVSNTARSTTISRRDTVAVTIEHILSCLTGLGVDNAVIELDNIEVPIMDGSARLFAEPILQDGLQNQGVPRKFIDIPQTLEMRDPYSDSWIKVEPAKAPSADVTIDFGSRIIGVQNVHWDLGTDYATEIGPARTFCFFHDIEYLFRNNLIKGGDLDNAIVVVEKEATEEQLQWVSQVFSLPELHVTDDGYLNNLKLHFPDECGRHKLLDLLGDIRLVGGYVNAHITAYKPGHALNTRAAKALRAMIK
ncbi:MAG: UDP-3-O-[3-hydroxymyristoyl] N-acetylglucosamine deacetylase [Bacteroidales bacterium]|nr:UDP-3-O-[3-hydroxymyristoyl] N-acetylglucosamine deacetylase [Bacteroidales bacterium]